MFCHNSEAFLFCLPKRCSRSRLKKCGSGSWLWPTKKSATAPQHWYKRVIIHPGRQPPIWLLYSQYLLNRFCLQLRILQIISAPPAPQHCLKVSYQYNHRSSLRKNLKPYGGSYLLRSPVEKSSICPTSARIPFAIVAESALSG